MPGSEIGSEEEGRAGDQDGESASGPVDRLPGYRRDRESVARCPIRGFDGPKKAGSITPSIK